MSESKLMVYRCKSCGAALQIGANPTSSVVVCNACGTQNRIENIVKNDEIRKKQDINSGVPLTADPAHLHQILVQALASSTNMPLDVFDEVEVLSESHVCVPGYCFEVTGNMGYTVDVGNERTREHTSVSSDRITVTEKKEIEYTTTNGQAFDSKPLFVSGSKEMSNVVTALYHNHDTGALVDVEDLSFPEDVYTCNPDMPQTTAFNQYVRPTMEKLLQQKALQSLQNSIYRNFTPGGCMVSRDETHRVFLGIYQITYRYKGKEYYMYVTGDGRAFYYEDLPNDTSRVTKAKALQDELNAVKDISWLSYVAGIGLFILLLVVKVPFLVSLIIGAVVLFGLKFFLGRKPAADRKAIQARIDAFNREPEEARQRFMSSGRRLKGIYSSI